MQRPSFKFRLFTAADTQNSAQAVTNLKGLCATYLPDRHEVEIVDVFREPERALAEGIFLTPTLIRLEPSPVVRIVGTLNDLEPVLRALGLETGAL